MNNEIYNKIGVEVLDQPQQKKSGLVLEKDVYNPSIAELEKVLKLVIDNYTDVCGFTLTFKRKYHMDDDRWLHRDVQNSIVKSRKWKDIKYIMFPEYTKNGNLHYHGIIWDEYQTVVMDCLKWWRRKYGFAKPELKLNSKFNWIKYITKDYGLTGLWTLNNLGKYKVDME